VSTKETTREQGQKNEQLKKKRGKSEGKVKNTVEKTKSMKPQEPLGEGDEANVNEMKGRTQGHLWRT